MLTQVGAAIASPILTLIADISRRVSVLTITLIPVVFVHTLTIILTRAGRTFVDVNLTVITHDVIATAARHAAVDVYIRSHEATQLIEELSGPCDVMAFHAS